MGKRELFQIKTSVYRVDSSTFFCYTLSFGPVESEELLSLRVEEGGTPYWSPEVETQ